MSRSSVPSIMPAGAMLRGFAQLFWLYFSWQTVVLGSACLGAAALALAFVNWFDPYRAYSMSLLAFALLLVVPLLAAPPMLRKMLGHRSISMVPRLPLLAGLALLLLTSLAALYIPVSATLLNMPGIGAKFGVQLFIVASAYVAVTQLLMTSQYGVLGFSLLPVVLIAVLALFGVDLQQWFRQESTLLGLGAVIAVGWLHALRELARRSAFKPAFVHTNTDYTNNSPVQGFARLWGLNLGKGASPAGTLLLAYPASAGVRLINIGSFVLVSPLIGASVLTLLPQEGPTPAPLLFMNTLLMLSLFCGCLSCFGYGELAARARLLWLRAEGDRTRLWRLMEHQVWINFAILAALLLPVALVAAYNNADTRPLHFWLLTLACAVYDTYRGLCSRLYCWPSLVQALVLLVSLGGVAGVVVYSALNGNVSLLVLMEMGVALLAVLLRLVARARFSTVDWLAVKHVLSKRAMVNP